MSKIFILFFSIITIMIFSLYNKKKKIEMKNKQAPAFKLKDETDNWVSLKDFLGKKVVLYFYPKDDSPGCTKEACSFRDNTDIYKQNNVVVLGISYDSPESHAEFKEKYELPFILLSDTNHEVAKAYGADQGLMGKFVADRKTFLINEQGKIIHVFESIDVTNHAIEILKQLGLR